MGRYGRLLDEALGVRSEGAVEGGLSGGMDGVGLTVVDLVWGHQAEAGVVMGLVVPGEERPAEPFRVLDAAEAARERRLVFEGFEVAFREWVVVGGMRPAVRLGDAEIGKQERGGLGLHRPAAVGMQSELSGRHLVLGDGAGGQHAGPVMLS